MSGPRVLTLDIETSGMVSLHFRLKNEFIGIDQVLEPTRVICFAAQWADSDKVMFFSEFHHGREKMLSAAYKLLDEADVLVGWNSRDFDNKHLLTELLLQQVTEEGPGEPSPLKHVDLMRQVQKRFYLDSYKLEWTVRRLALGGKMRHEGVLLWIKCRAGDKLAWNRMRRYCKQDVVVTNLARAELWSWLKVPHADLFREDTGEEMRCPNCEKTNLEKRGYAYTDQSKFQRYRCLDCGRWMRDTKRLASVRTVAVA